MDIYKNLNIYGRDINTNLFSALSVLFCVGKSMTQGIGVHSGRDTTAKYGEVLWNLPYASFSFA